MSSTLHDFLEEQRVKYQMSRRELSEQIREEHRTHHAVLFGVDYRRDSGRNQSEFRFPDELAALYAYVRAAMRLGRTGYRLPQMDESFAEKSSRRSRKDPTVRPRKGGKTRLSGSPVDLYLDDFVDVGDRLFRLPEGYLELLFNHYVLRIGAKVHAEELGITPASLGGRISRARAALAKSLDGLIPPRRRHNRADRERARPGPLTEQELLEERRDKVSRMLTKRLTR